MTQNTAQPGPSEAPRSSAPRPKGITLPDKPDTKCARCLVPRRGRTQAWTRVLWQGQQVGWVCPECPRPNEPIRRVTTSSGVVRYRYTVTATPTGTRKAIQKTGTADTLTEARAQVQAISAEIRATGTYARPTRLTVRDLADRWLREKEKDVAAGNLRASTLNSSYRSALTTVCRHIGAHEAGTVTAGQVRALLNTLKVEGGETGRPLGKASLGMALLSLRMIFAWAIEQKWVEANPAASVKVPKVEADASEPATRAWRVWTPDEYRSFLAHVDATHAAGTTASAREPWVRAGMRLTLCGLRMSEVLGLSWEAVDLATGTVSVVASRTKTGRGTETEVGPPKSKESRRVVPVEDVAPGTKAALRDLWLAQGQPTTGLVILDTLGHPVYPDAYSRRFRTLREAAGVPDLGSIHRLRHTIATVLHEAGVAPVEGASLLGHSTATHIAFYVPTSDAAGAKAAAKAGAILAPRAAGAVF